MRFEFPLLCCLTVLVISCAPYKEFEKTPEHERRVLEVRNQRNKDHGFVGKWQEYKRTSGKTIVNFTDTMRYDFFMDSSVNIYDAVGRINRAKSGRKKKGLFIGTNTYKAFKMRDGIMTLGNRKESHYLKKIDRFYLAPIAKVSPKVNKGTIGVLDGSFLSGEWKIYKKTDPNFDRQKAYLHKLEIGESKPDGTYNVLLYNNASNKIIRYSGSMSIANNTISLVMKDLIRKYSIISAEGDELVLQDGGVMYYLKKVAK